MFEPLPAILTFAHPRPGVTAALLLLWQSPPGGDATGIVCCAGIVVVIVFAVVISNSNKQAAARAAEEAAARQEADRSERAALRQKYAAQREARALGEARAAYEDSLARLKASPTSADLRQRALDLGRTYSGLTRGSQAAALFDEDALMNDINAATAGAVAFPETGAGRLAGGAHEPGRRPTIEERLALLAELKVQGLISEEEYSAKRQRIIDEI